MNLINRSNILAVAGMLLLVLMLVSPVFSEEEYNIEGTVYEPGRPERSMAVINGEMHKIGDHVGEYRLAEIYANGALLKHMHSEKTLSLLVGRDAPPVTSAEVLQNESGGKRTSAFSGFNFFNPLSYIQKAKEVSVLAKVQQIKMALEVYYSENGNYPKALQELEKEQILNPAVLAQRGGYKYIYESTNVAYRLLVEPERPARSSRFFFVDDTGVIRAEEGRQASKTSPVLE